MQLTHGFSAPDKGDRKTGTDLRKVKIRTTGFPGRREYQVNQSIFHATD
ncbi:hypothetical protein ENTCAN_05107 [Enterobacter cancerogenus ATCC 35316]|nr:hypothetical protein ENTCAN_05107 [Enterobacter cancerogenus ATCC 35316]